MCCMHLLLPNRTLLTCNYTCQLKNLSLHFLFSLLPPFLPSKPLQSWETFETALCFFEKSIFICMFRCPTDEVSLSLSQSTTTHPQCQCVPCFDFLMTGQIPAQLCRLRASAGCPHQAAAEGRSLLGRTGVRWCTRQEPWYGVLAMTDFAEMCIESL